MVYLQKPQDERQRTWRRLALLIIIVLPLIAGACLWILSITGLINGAWSSLFAAIFTAVGAISTVVGVISAFSRENQRPSVKTSSIPPLTPLLRERTPTVSLTEINLGVNRRKGALIVKVGRKHSGATVNLCHGFDQDDSRVDIASNVVLRMVDGSPTLVALFPAVEPDNYTASIPPAGLWANVTIQAGQVMEIDWRYHRIPRRRFGQWLQINLRIS